MVLCLRRKRYQTRISRQACGLRGVVARKKQRDLAGRDVAQVLAGDALDGGGVGVQALDLAAQGFDALEAGGVRLVEVAILVALALDVEVAAIAEERGGGAAEEDDDEGDDGAALTAEVAALDLGIGVSAEPGASMLVLASEAKSEGRASVARSTFFSPRNRISLPIGPRSLRRARPGERVPACVARVFAELFLDAEELVVLGGALAARAGRRS